MSLKTNWQEAPKVITTGRTVRYAAEPTSWADSDGNTVNLYWTVSRVSSMAFNILALTQSASESGAAALQREYTRRYARWTADVDNSTSPPSVRVLKTNALLCTSSITPRLVEGSIWHIEATIDETDEIIADHEPTYDEFEELFALALARESADDGLPSFVITEAHWDSTRSRTTIFWSAANIQDFSPSRVSVQVRSGTWQAASVVPGSMGVGGCIISIDRNAAIRVVYNLGAADEVASAPYSTNDPALPSIALEPAEYSGGMFIYLTFALSGAPAAMSGVTDLSRWSARLFNGNELLNESFDRISRLSPLGDNRYTAMISPTGGLDETLIKHWFNVAGGALTAKLVYSRGDNTAFADGTVTLANYVEAESVDVVDASPGALRLRIVLATDIADGVFASAVSSVSATAPKPGMGDGSVNTYAGTVERLALVDSNSTVHRYAAMVSFANVNWQLADLYLTIRGLFAVQDYDISATFSIAATVKFPLRAITAANYSADAQKTYLSVFAWDVAASWELSSMSWLSLSGDTWDDFYTTPSASSLPPNFTGYADGNITLAPIRALDDIDGYDCRFYPATAEYLRPLRVVVANGFATVAIDWRIAGYSTTAVLNGCTFEIWIDGETVAFGSEVSVLGDTLRFARSFDPGEYTLTVLATYNAGASTVYSEPFDFTVEG